MTIVMEVNSMSWLKDVEEKRRKVLEAQARLESEQKQKNEEFESEFQRLTPLVRKLLRELGYAWWGKSAHLYVQSHLNGHWRLKKTDSDEEYPYWNVFLEGEETPFYFMIQSHGGYVKTVDTSEEELKRALRKAAENGPIERADKENL